MTNPGRRFDRPRPAAPFLARIILGGGAILLILAITVTIANSATVDVVYGAVASASLILGVAIGATALLMTVVYFGLSGRWPWQ